MQLFFELIQVSLGNRDMLSHVPTEEEWNALFEAARKQAVAGVAFMGISRYVEITHKKLVSVKGLEVSVDEEEFDESWLEAVNLPEELYYTWMQQAMDIQKRNRLMDKRCVELQKMLSDAGFRSCILKGQGVARLYKSQSDEKCEGFERFENKDKHEDTLTTNPSTLTHYRQSGDIDVWVEGGYEKVNKWVQQIAPTRKVDGHHANFKYFDDAVVEVHFVPINHVNPFKNRRLQQFFKSQAESVYFNNVTKNIESENTFTTPTIEFNLVHLLVHIYHHLMTEGVGLRQVMDYYFVLQTSSKVPSSKFQEVRKTIKELGLERFTGALLWVINEVFIGHSPNQTTLTPNLNIEPNEEDGRFLLEEIMKSGNFGKQDERQKNLYKNKWNSFWTVHFKTFRFWRFDHWAWFWSPLCRIKRYTWRKINGYL